VRLKGLAAKRRALPPCNPASKEGGRKDTLNERTFFRPTDTQSGPKLGT